MLYMKNMIFEFLFEKGADCLVDVFMNIKNIDKLGDNKKILNTAAQPGKLHNTGIFGIARMHRDKGTDSGAVHVINLAEVNDQRFVPLFDKVGNGFTEIVGVFIPDEGTLDSMIPILPLETVRIFTDMFTTPHCDYNLSCGAVHSGHNIQQTQ